MSILVLVRPPGALNRVLLPLAGPRPSPSPWSDRRLLPPVPNRFPGAPGGGHAGARAMNRRYPDFLLTPGRKELWVSPFQTVSWEFTVEVLDVRV